MQIADVNGVNLVEILLSILLFTTEIRLCNISSCPDIIRSNYVLPVESLTIAGGMSHFSSSHHVARPHTTEKGEWADKDKRKSFLQEYGDASDKEHFLSEKRSQCHDIHQVYLKLFPFGSSLISF